MDNEIVCIVNMFDAEQSLRDSNGIITKIPTNKISKAIPVMYNNCTIHFYGNTDFIQNLVNIQDNMYSKNNIKIEVN